MALSRKMLAAMDIPAEKIDEIITAHTETVNAIKEERDGLKADSERLRAVEKDLAKATEELEKFKAGDWEKKYTDLKSEYSTYKTDVETKAAKTAKETAYKQLLVDAGVSDKRIGAVMRVSNLDSITLDKDGKIEGADKLLENVKTEWADFIVTKREEGAGTPKPPAGDGSTPKEPSRAAQLAAQFRNEHYGVQKEE